MKKISALCVVSLLSLSVMTGCSGKDVTVETKFPAREINRVEIESHLDEIIIHPVDGDEIIVAADIKDNQEKGFCSLDGSTLKIKAGEAVGINLPEDKTLTLGIPSGAVESLSIDNSQARHMQITGIDVQELFIDIVTGDVTIAGMDGIVSAEARNGEIVSELEIARDIRDTPSRLGSILSSQIGENSKNTITVNVGQGDIAFK